MTHLPFFCDLLAMISLILGIWWVRKIGTATLIGITATVINFIFRPMAFHFLGFTVASIVFDMLAFVVGYNRVFNKKLGSLILIVLSVVSAWVAGLIIGSFFMGGRVSVLFFSLLHSIGGLIGSVLGVMLIKGLEARGVRSVSVTGAS